jgi:phosphate transport system ATP-binding protein
MPEQPVRLGTDKLTAMYGKFTAVKNVTLTFANNSVNALIGPSGCGKSTFLRTLNRMHELSEGGWITGKVLLDGQDVYQSGVSPMQLRRRVGMVFQKPTPFPTMSIYDNVAAGLRLDGRPRRGEQDEIVERSLKQAALWDEVKDRLRTSAVALSGGQQQRLCIARSIAPRPEVLLLDEPTASLDPAGDLADRGAGIRAQAGVHDRNRDAQHAAGGAGVGHHDLLLYGIHDRDRSDPAALHSPEAGTD